MYRIHFFIENEMSLQCKQQELNRRLVFPDRGIRIGRCIANADNDLSPLGIEYLNPRVL